ncbi:MAG TPA: GyrI-like domain-containing protein [Leptospiraceae bacterium]|nr:GyrI-like domain-containing protein [Leptospiraceae bacterium]HMW07734.1 GyrI-like domain-containing protein [Leptospiraceae bacterium]HMX31996.1 GyrI-like domain-containing protein [Leptospiraceae bacterium]HMY33400.1 GyrI-like domain-containing protein [Leptospiraceae bacterium]HMZ64792.1 GyrI-like domain-containing protein [Leptospiraceae bacterium]
MKHFSMFLFAFIIFTQCMPSPDLAVYQSLKDPKISTKSSIKVLTITLTGDPSQTSGEAFGKLYKLKYKLKNDSLKEAWPRARWPKPFETPRNEYVGIFALPVSNEVDSIPENIENPEPKVQLETWNYGSVAEILHIGSYQNENPTVEKLKKFISENDYEIIGFHEEEYLKGPGMFFKGNPDEYQTIIRYPVKKLEKK